MKRILSWAMFSLAALAPCMARGETYRLEYQTVYDEEEVTAYRLESETVCEEKQVTTYRPVIETEMRERRYTVSRPVTETVEHEERFTVMRPVTETAEREERHIVRRPVCETAERDEISTVMEPVTTYQTNYVDAGGYVDQQVVTPGRAYNRLRWVPSGSWVDPATGAYVVQRGGLAWVPSQGPSTCTVNRVWQPNVVAQQVPQTSYVQRQITRKVPVQVTRYVDEEVVNKIPVQVTRMVEEQQVRKVPVTTTRMVCEERVDQIPVRVQKMVAVEETVREPRVIVKKVPVTFTRRTPRTIVMKIPIDDCSPTPTCCGGGDEITTRTIVPAPRSNPYVSPKPADTRAVPPRRTSKSAESADEAPKLNPGDKIGPAEE